MTDTVIRKSIYLQASREVVWDYLTQPDKLAIWFHAPKTPLIEGAEFALYGAESGNKICWGTVSVARAPEYLEYSFTIKPMGGADSTVRWTLEAVEGGMRLSLEHDGLPTGAEGFGLTLSLDKGWEEHMGSMRADIHENTN
ncbi:MAG: SRPBCC family protein [Sulfitobacter sp.]